MSGTRTAFTGRQRLEWSDLECGRSGALVRAGDPEGRQEPSMMQVLESRRTVAAVRWSRPALQIAQVLWTSLWPLRRSITAEMRKVFLA